MNLIPAITREGMKEIDRIMTQDLGIDVPLMMEHAGLNLAKVVRKYYEKFNYDRIIVISGSGNNGGGGMVAARRLKNWGYDATIVLPKGDPNRPFPQEQLEIAQQCGVKVLYQIPKRNVGYPLIVDALIGYNFRGNLIGMTKEVIDWMRLQSVISLDIPSGVDSSTGINLGLLEPIATVTLAFPKTGLLNMHKANLGQTYLADIGVPLWAYDNQKMYLGEKANFTDLQDLGRKFSEKSVFPISISEEGWSIIPE